MEMRTSTSILLGRQLTSATYIRGMAGKGQYAPEKKRQLKNGGGKIPFPPKPEESHTDILLNSSTTGYSGRAQETAGGYQASHWNDMCHFGLGSMIYLSDLVSMNDDGSI